MLNYWTLQAEPFSPVSIFWNFSHWFSSSFFFCTDLDHNTLMLSVKLMLSRLIYSFWLNHKRAGFLLGRTHAADIRWLIYDSKALLYFCCCQNNANSITAPFLNKTVHWHFWASYFKTCDLMVSTLQIKWWLSCHCSCLVPKVAPVGVSGGGGARGELVITWEVRRL